MKKLLLDRISTACTMFCATGFFIAFSSTPASASLLIYEPFDYSTQVGNPIIGQTPTLPGSAWARAGTASTATVHNIVAPSLTAPSGFPASIGNGGVTIGGPASPAGDFTEYARLSLGSQYGVNSTLYYSLLLNVPSTTGMTVPNSNLNANNDGIIAFNNATGAGARPSIWAGELTMRLGVDTSKFNLGVRSSTTAAGTTYWSTDLNPAQTYLVVVRYTSGPTAGDGFGLSSLWIDPTSFGGDAPTADGNTTGSMNLSASLDHLDSLILGAGIAAGADPSQTFVDEIRVGTTWADVTAVPEPSTLVLAGLGALGLVSWYRARRR